MKTVNMCALGYIDHQHILMDETKRMDPEISSFMHHNKATNPSCSGYIIVD